MRTFLFRPLAVSMCFKKLLQLDGMIKSLELVYTKWFNKSDRSISAMLFVNYMRINVIMSTPFEKFN
jgi:hypothetical protein